MGRLLGLDVGARRTGMAATDELQLICSPLKTVETDSLMKEIEDMHAHAPFDAIVVGKPNLIVSSDTDATPIISDVVAKLTKRFPSLPVHFVDENHTSAEASAIQRAGGMKKSQRREKGSLDAIAASLILQRHLDAQSYS